MDLQALKDKQEAASNRFDEIKAQVDHKQKEISGLDDELKRLQGEYRACEELIKSLEPKDASANTEANVIDATPTLTEESKKDGKSASTTDSSKPAPSK